MTSQQAFKSRCVKAAVMTVALSLGGLLAACGSSSNGSTKAAGPSSYAFGAALPLSGGAEAVGLDFKRGIQTAAAQVNANGGIDGVPLKVYFADNQLSASGSVSAWDQLVSVHHVTAAIQTSSAGVTATAPLATKDKVLMLNPGGEDPTLQGLSPYLISDIPSIKAEVDDMLPYLKSKGYKSMVIYGEADALGQTTSAYVKSSWTKMGGTYLGAKLESVNSVDHSAVISQIKALNPSVVYMICGGSQASTFIKQARAEGLSVQLAGASPLQAAGDIFPVAGSAANGTITTNVTQTLSPSNPRAVAYEKEYDKLFPGQKQYVSDIYAIYGHDAVMMYVEAVKYLIKHKITYTGPNLTQAILHMGTFKVAGGTTIIHSNGSASGTVTFYRAVNQKWAPFKTVSSS